MTNPALRAHRITVLLVDDQAIIGRAVEQMLVGEDMDFHFCQNPTQAVKMASEIRPTVILQDLIMPEIEGLTLARYFRANPLTREIPLIVLSSKDDADIKAQAFQQGANDYLVKLPDRLELLARIGYHSQGYIHRLERNEALEKLEQANHFIRETFGRYLSEEVVDTILESPQGLRLGGEKRVVTVLMSDLRGFTSLSERLAAEEVVNIINGYLEIMTDIIFKYQGIIDEFIGDAILAIFGAPVARADHAERAVACALDMQLAMDEVNRRNREAGYPEVTMGIGINTGDLVVGNIGSKKRAKYGVVGRNVNLASRIESYSVGGQVLISASTLAACGPNLRIDGQTEVMPKGVQSPITISEIGGIGGDYNLHLPLPDPQSIPALSRPLNITFSPLVEKHAGEHQYAGRLLRLGERVAECEAGMALAKWTNLKITLFDPANHPVTTELYGKITRIHDPRRFEIAFTSVPPEAEPWLKPPSGN